ncbi:hypothetical protein FRB99_002936, partial [Tulasnella sp. 403]
LDAARIVNVGEYSRLAIVRIGVEFGAPSFEEGSVVAVQCRTLIDSYNIHDYHVEIRESRVMGQAGNSRPLVSPDFHRSRPIHRDSRPWAEGTAGFYLSAGGDDKNIYLVTVRHVVLPVDKDDNKEYERTNTSKAREDVVVLGTSGFNEKLAAIDYDIRGQESTITDTKERIRLAEGVNDPESVTERKAAEQDLKKAVEGLEAPMTLHHEITTQWEAEEKRGIGELPPSSSPPSPHQYNKYTRQQFMDKVYSNPTSPPSFKFPADRIVTLQGQVPESDFAKPPMLDANGDQCLVVFKNGAKAGTTIGRANNVSSYTRRYFAGKYQESREWPVIPTDTHSGAFSAKGNSGSGVADTLGRVGGTLTSGTSDPNATGAVDVTERSSTTPSALSTPTSPRFSPRGASGIHVGEVEPLVSSGSWLT